jgi:YHS domain-containing protein
MGGLFRKELNMDWLYQNWIWIVALVGGYLLMSRMGIGGCGMGHSHGHDHASAGGHGSGATEKAADTIKLFDPVSQHMLPVATGIASVHQGRVYYFEDRANRDAFESEPEKYLAGAPVIGQAIAASAAQAKQAHRGHGCC